MVLESACLGSYEALRNLMYRGPSEPFLLTVAMRNVLRSWSVALSLRPMPSGHISHNPLWLNLSLLEFISIPDLSVWVLKGIKYVDQICTGDQLQTFDWLKQKYDARF